MDESQFARMRMRFSALAALGIWGLLAWRHLHGGVPVHHVLHRGDLPGISSGWDGILVPVLAWWLVGRTRRRLVMGDGTPGPPHAVKAVVLGWAGALAFGLALSWGAVHGAPAAASAPAALLLLGLFFPIHRAECVLGFVLGMTPGVGSTLPLVFGTVMAGAGAGVHLGLRPLLIRAGRWILGA